MSVDTGSGTDAGVAWSASSLAEAGALAAHLQAIALEPTLAEAHGRAAEIWMARGKATEAAADGWGAFRRFVDLRLVCGGTRCFAGFC